MKRSRSVQQLLDHGGSAWAVDNLGALSWFTFCPDERRGAYSVLRVRAGDREVQVSVSPTGRSVRVFVDGVEAKPPAKVPAG